jgi:hypothetical protein
MIQRIVSQKKQRLKRILGIFLLDVTDKTRHSLLGRHAVPVKVAKVNIGCDQKSMLGHGLSPFG